MVTEQFDHFWEIRCPHCNEVIDLEILVNQLKKIKNDEVTIGKK
jgi:phage FluMu protein Com